MVKKNDDPTRALNVKRRNPAWKAGLWSLFAPFWINWKTLKELLGLVDKCWLYSLWIPALLFVILKYVDGESRPTLTPVKNAGEMWGQWGGLCSGNVKKKSVLTQLVESNYLSNIYHLGFGIFSVKFSIRLVKHLHLLQKLSRKHIISNGWVREIRKQVKSQTDTSVWYSQCWLSWDQIQGLS